jgi:hypothetical protein
MKMKENQSDDSYDGKSDHQVILELEKETAQQASQISELMNRFKDSEYERLELVKQQNQSAIVRLVFAGICGLLICTLGVSIIFSLTNAVDAGLKEIMALSERILLVLTGILSSVAAGMFESRKSNGG